MKILVCAYRTWAFKILPYFNDLIKLAVNPEQLIEKYQEFKPNVVILLGWSWKVPEEIYKNTPTICLHPSYLPKYRGGSPLQHQIMKGEERGAVSFFLIDGTLDGGGLLAQEEISLEGTLKDIFKRIQVTGGILLQEILAQYPDFKPYPQQGEPTIYKRRKPSESELKIDDFKNKPAEELYNFIRALADPYPNAFIRCKDGKNLYFKEVSLNGA